MRASAAWLPFFAAFGLYLPALGFGLVWAFEKVGEETLRRNALPMSVLLGPGGTLRAAYLGVPSVSELRKAGVGGELL